MKHEDWFDTKEEATAFLRGLNIGGGVRDAFYRAEGDMWKVTFWTR